MTENSPNTPSMTSRKPVDRLGRVLRGTLAAQAWWAGGWQGNPTLPPRPEIDPSILCDQVQRSPRANGYLSLEEETRLFGNPQAFLGYSTWGRNALITGGLHGKQEHQLDALSNLRTALSEQGFKRILAFPIAPDERSLYEKVRFQQIQVGAEAFLDLQEFSLRGGRRESLRQMVNRAQKRFELRTREVPPEEAAPTLAPLYQQWLQSRRRGYRLRLLVGTPSFHQPLGRRYFAVFDKSGEIPWAFLTMTPGWGGKGYGLDVLARHPQAPPGAVDLLISESLFALQQEGIEVFSLGSCPLIETGDPEIDDPRRLRWAFRLLRDKSWGNHIFRFQSLFRFKEKFAPRWEPVYMAGWPNVGFRTLYAGCRMWGLFGPPRLRID